MRSSLYLAAFASAALAASAGAQFSTPNPTVKNPVKVPVKAANPDGPITPSTGGTSTFVGGSDDCTTADAISGPGTYSVNTTAATSGAPIGSCGLIGRDVWFRYTASTTSVVTFSTCGGTMDSVIAIWADAGAGVCPTTQLACLDDSCGLQTSLSTSVTAGASVDVEFGGYNSQVYSGTFTVTETLPATNDGCAGPITVVGNGPHPFNTTSATTGAEGQSEAACLAFGITNVYNDVWFTWVATSTDTFRLSLCGGGAAYDTRMAVYPGAGCPATGTALACNDDFCGLVSQLTFSGILGNTYTVQIGAYSPSGNGTGTFSFTPIVPIMNDPCATPTTVVGNGPHPFDTTQATTGAEGQSEAACLAYGITNVYNDVWFTWVATATSSFELSLCSGGVGYDSRMAVYPGAGCPAAGTALACNDDSCGLVSALCFQATLGNSYTIQIGAYAAAGTGSGTFLLTPSGPPAGGCTALDDGSSENSIGLTAGGAMCWMTGFGTPAQSTTVSSVSTCFGTPLFPGNFIPSGPVTIAVWDDPNDDGNPSDCVLVTSTTAVISAGSIDTDVFQVITLPAPVSVSGLFFVGACVNHPAGQYAGPLDQSGGSLCSTGPEWVFGDTTGTANLTVLTANNVPPASLASVGLPGNWLLRASCSNEPGSGYCFGDGIDPNVTTLCPCGNNGAPGRGCASSFNAAGARITASGVTAGDDVATVGTGCILHGDGMNLNPALTCIFIKGDMNDPTGIIFGDGLRCTTGTLIRLKSEPLTASGTADFPMPGDPLPLSTRGGTPPGSGFTGYYAVYYRNAAGGFCPPATFNSSNGYMITW